MVQNLKTKLCAFDRGSSQKEWKAKLDSHNTVFQAESLALKEAIAWESGQKGRAKLWCDSEPVVNAIISPKSRNSIIQKIQISLLNNTKIEVGLVKAHTEMRRLTNWQRRQRRKVLNFKSKLPNLSQETTQNRLTLEMANRLG
ncbi:hypothetical protein AVEN_149336-1 [Araneus ventricosus]|uniref:RNase H type-1 domain-containing protein n=1 Tax=Araneus ventricosus TaxID=182803 RepID=A0A4Y2J605_ARAVE|nr:hypothetical protein AVEN_270765-1 [Araneus ventricosus]GBM84633.1 hypothetical protein AVEN_149336-1 [Araneus ventricosus]